MTAADEGSLNIAADMDTPVSAGVAVVAAPAPAPASRAPEQAAASSEQVIRFGATLPNPANAAFDIAWIDGAIKKWFSEYGPEGFADIDLSPKSVSVHEDGMDVETYCFDVGAATVKRYEIAGPVRKAKSPIKRVEVRIEVQQNQYGQQFITFEVPVPGDKKAPGYKEQVSTLALSAQKLMAHLRGVVAVEQDGIVSVPPEGSMETQLAEADGQEAEGIIDEATTPQGELLDVTALRYLLKRSTRKLPIIINSIGPHNPTNRNVGGAAGRMNAKQIRDQTRAVEAHRTATDTVDVEWYEGLAHHVDLSNRQLADLQAELGLNFTLGVRDNIRGVQILFPPQPGEEKPRFYNLTSQMVFATRGGPAAVDSMLRQKLLDGSGFVTTASHSTLTVANMRAIDRLAGILQGTGLGGKDTDAQRLIIERLLNTEDELVRSWESIEVALDLAAGGERAAARAHNVNEEMLSRLEVVTAAAQRFEAELADAQVWAAALEEDNARLTAQVAQGDGGLYPPIAKMPEWLARVCVKPETECGQTVLLSNRAELWAVPTRDHERVFECVQILHAFNSMVRNIDKSGDKRLKERFDAACKAASVQFGYSLSDRSQYDRYGAEYYTTCPETGERVTLSHHFRAGVGKTMFRMYVGFNSNGQAVVGPVGNLHLEYSGSN